MNVLKNLLTKYKLRLKRRRFLLRAFMKRRQLAAVTVHGAAIKDADLLAFSTVRNEISRLPYFLSYYRDLGVQHFLIVDNDSDDGTAAFLDAQGDVSVWHTSAGYKQSRFGVDWLQHLLFRHGHGKWCLTVDADELLTFPHFGARGLGDLTAHLDTTGRAGFGAMMLDMYHKGRIGDQTYDPGADPLGVLTHYDAGPYRWRRQEPVGNYWQQGGARERVFFPDAPDLSPTLNKIPLVKWNRKFAYVNSTHAILPREMNEVFNFDRTDLATGVLLHTKFLPEIIDRSGVEKQRQEHFGIPDQYRDYYDQIGTNPGLWSENSHDFDGWEQLVKDGLMTKGTWT